MALDFPRQICLVAVLRREITAPRDAPASPRGHKQHPRVQVILPSGAPMTEQWYNYSFSGGGGLPPIETDDSYGGARVWRRERFGNGHCEDGRGVGFISPLDRMRRARDPHQRRARNAWRSIEDGADPLGPPNSDVRQ